MRLRDALRVQRGDVVAFVGAGGKTSALFRLANELRADGWRVLATTTTKLASHELKHAPLAARLDAHTKPAEIREWLDLYGCVFLYSEEDARGRKVTGLEPEQIDTVVQRQQATIDELRRELDRLRQQLAQLMEERPG